ncbi:hypothetical protein GJAV_G00264760 [Gymnothorax javanicus]|nr:hypothetical protein GJAV_G00264760 [Gymnothorax javanicus]
MRTTGVALLLLLISAISPNHAETTTGSLTGIHDMNPNDVTSDGSSVIHAVNSATDSHDSNNDVHMSTSSQHGPVPETLAATHGMPMMNPSTEHDVPMSTSSQHGPVPETHAATHGMPMNPSTEHDVPMSTSSRDGHPTPTPGPTTPLPSPHGLFPNFSSARVRLMDGEDRCSGRVEVFHDGQWGSVCDDLDINAADVVCRELGCGRALLAPGQAAFGQGSGPVVLGDVSCVGSESSLTHCQHPGYGKHNCSHRRDAAVVCAKVRLVDGDGQCSGRVEVLHDGQWGTVCDDGWNTTNTDVVCREMGCGTALDILGSTHFGIASGPIWLDDVTCSGDEPSLTQCQHSEYGKHNCDHYEDVALRCTGPVRLVNGFDECAGTVELFHGGTWGTVCGNNWDINEAEVVCRQLNCGNAITALNMTRSGPHSEPIWLDDMMCSGDEASLTHCQHTGFGRHICDDHGHAGVVCSASTQVRLRDGSDQCSGRVEVYHGEWGAVCDDRWGMNEAEVVCRQLGCGSAVTNASFTHEESSSPDLLGEVACSGKESSLFQCQHSGFGRRNCEDHEDAGVVCSASAHVRLVNGSDQCSGMVEVYHGEWGTVCNDHWDMNNVEVVCRQLGCGSAVTTIRFNRSGEDSGNTWFDDVRCSGNESSLGDCQLIGSGFRGCSNDEVAGVSCTESGHIVVEPADDQCPEIEDALHEDKSTTMCDDILEVRDVFLLMSRIFSNFSAQVRLVNGSSRCSGRVEVYHDYQWGTVCDDDWDMNNAEVVCREVGCGRALGTGGHAHSGQGTPLPTWLDGVKCKGTESSLKQCQHSEFGEKNCHHEVAAVVCTGMNPHSEMQNGYGGAF